MSAITTSELRTIGRRAIWALSTREMRRVLSLWTQTLLPPVITGLIFLAVFGGALGTRLQAIDGVRYVRFVLPGLRVMTVAAQAFANNSASLVITPLALLGGVFYAAHRLHEPWHMLTQIDPLYYLTDATRYGHAGIHEAPIAAALLVALGVAAAAFDIATAVIARGWRIKP